LPALVVSAPIGLQGNRPLAWHEISRPRQSQTLGLLQGAQLNTPFRWRLGNQHS
jgi:hypothetical protein